MKIQNAKIKDVTVGFDDRDMLAVSFSLNGQYTGSQCSFNLEDPVDVQRLIKLMQYTCSYEVGDLNGKIVRKGDTGHLLRGFGHPCEDKFIPVLTEEFQEITEAEFEELSKNI